MLSRALLRNIQLTRTPFFGLVSAPASLRRSSNAACGLTTRPEVSDHTRRSRVLRVNTSADANRARQRLGAKSAHPAKVLDQFVAEGNANLDVVRECLNKYFNDLNPHPRQTRLAMIRKRPIAKVALQQVWKDNTGWLDLVLKDFETQFRLCYFVAAEGLDDLIVSWLKVELPADVRGTVNPQEYGAWRGQLFRNLLRARLALDHERSMDKALQLFFATRDDWELAWSNFKQQRQQANGGATTKPPFLFLSFYPAAVELSLKLANGTSAGTSSQLFDRFTGIFAHLLRRKDRSPYYDDLVAARLQMSHPRTPDVDPIISYLRKTFGEKPTEEARTLLPAVRTAQYYMHYDSFVRAAAIAQAKGKEEDAKWLERKAKELFVEHVTIADLDDRPVYSDQRAQREWKPKWLFRDR